MELIEEFDVFTVWPFMFMWPVEPTVEQENLFHKQEEEGARLEKLRPRTVPLPRPRPRAMPLDITPKNIGPAGHILYMRGVAPQR